MAVAAACALAAGVAVAATGDVPVKVSPAHGSTKTTYVVKFTSAQDLGTSGLSYSDYRVVATGPHSSARCAGDADMTVDHGASGDRIRVALAPPAGQRWCKGAFEGKLFYEHGPNCPSDHTGPCPMFPSTMTEVGHFTFRTSR
jgi:hypothetical protein